MLRRAGIEAPILLLSQPRPADIDAAVRLGPAPERLHRRRASTAMADARPGATGHGGPRAPQGQHRDEPGGRGPRRHRRRWPRPIAADPSSTSRRCGPTARWPTSPATRSPTSSSTASTQVWAELGRAGSGPADAPRGQHRGRHRPPAQPLRPGPGRHRHLRHRRRRRRWPAGSTWCRRMTLRAEVAMVKRVAAGERISYGLPPPLRPRRHGGHRAHRLRRRRAPAAVAGRRRGADRRAAPPDRGRRHHGPADGRLRRRPVAVGDEVVLIGRQGDEMISAQDWADRLDTIAYEIVCGIGPRVPRHYRPASGPSRRPGGAGPAPAVASTGAHHPRRARRRGQHLHPLRAWPTGAPRWCSGWATPTPTCCSWGRARAPRRTARACPSWAAPASCSTGSCSRSWA